MSRLYYALDLPTKKSVKCLGRDASKAKVAKSQVNVIFLSYLHTIYSAVMASVHGRSNNLLPIAVIRTLLAFIVEDR